MQHISCATMKKYNISYDLVCSIQSLTSNATSVVFHNGSILEWFKTNVGVRQGCLQSPMLFNVFFRTNHDIKWYGNVSRSSGLSTTILQGTVNGGRRRDGQRKRWEDNINELTGLSIAESLGIAGIEVSQRMA